MVARLMRIKKSQIKKAIENISSKYGIKHAELFGSYVNGRVHDKSDIDILLEFNNDTISLITLLSIKYELEEKLGKEVDVLHAPIPENSFIEIGKSEVIYERQ